MIRALIHTLKNWFEPKAIVLMYHRVAILETDVWRLAVRPAHFEEHLQVLSRNWQVIPLSDLAEDLKNRKLKNNSVAITFDDGYADNFLTAKPLLEKYRLPATFFVSSSTIGQQTEFWWDELENLILQTEILPQTLNLEIEGTPIQFDLGSEGRLTAERQAQQQHWKAYVHEPPTLRCGLYLKLWQALRPLTQQVQQHYLKQLRNWAGLAESNIRPLHRSMTLQELNGLGQSSFCQIGAHTVSHPDLPGLSAQAQEQEIRENKVFLEKVIGKNVALFAYPYGSYSKETVRIAANENFSAAVTTNGNLVRLSSERMLLGRFLVDDWPGQQLEGYLKTWLK